MVHHSTTNITKHGPSGDANSRSQRLMKPKGSQWPTNNPYPESEEFTLRNKYLKIIH